MREDRAADDLADLKRKLALSDAELATLMAVDDSRSRNCVLAFRWWRMR